MSKAAREYHLIDLARGISHGGFISLAGARQFARQERLPAWDIFHGAESTARPLDVSATQRPRASPRKLVANFQPRCS